MIHHLRHLLLLPLLNDPALAPSVATSISPWSIHRSFNCSLIHRWPDPSLLGFHPDPKINSLQHPLLLLLLSDPSIAPSIAPWSTAYTIYRSQINRLHHPTLILLVSGSSLEPCIAHSIAPWSIACSTHRSFNCSVIHCSLHPSLLLVLPDLLLAPSIACTSRQSFHRSLIHRSHNPSLFLLLPDPSLAPFVALSIDP